MPLIKGGQSAVELRDQAGRQPFITPFGDLIVAERDIHVSARFAYGLSPRDVEATTADGATAAVADDMAVLTSGANAAGSVLLESHEKIRYTPGHMVFAQITAEFTCSGTAGQKIGVTNCDQFVGIGDADDGFAVGFQGNGGFCIRRRRGGVDTYIAQADLALIGLTAPGARGPG